MAEVNVAIYKAPSIVDLAHWVRKENLFLVYQILGYATVFRFECSEGKVDNSERFFRYVSITKDFHSLESLHDAICNTPVNNDDQDFNCQSWAIELLRKTNQTGLITEHEYLQTAAKLEEVFGTEGIPHLSRDANIFR
jgi:hypothetical protein